MRSEYHRDLGVSHTPKNMYEPNEWWCDKQPEGLAGRAAWVDGGTRDPPFFPPAPPLVGAEIGLELRVNGGY